MNIIKNAEFLSNASDSSVQEQQKSQSILITVLMPCLNEARTLETCIKAAHDGCRAALTRYNTKAGIESKDSDARSSDSSYEIIVADNGSSDGSQDIAQTNGAIVVQVEQRGYGAALIGGIAASRGRYIVMGDSDCSYDFLEIPNFIDKLIEGSALVMGNRFSGSIMPGAMPWHHRYIGNPILSLLGRTLFGTACRDWHCGLRAFNSKSIKSLHFKSDGMEFASEMVIKFATSGFEIAEIPITLRPDGRDRPPHLRSIRDGARHVKTIIVEFLRNKIHFNKLEKQRLSAGKILHAPLFLVAILAIFAVASVPVVYRQFNRPVTIKDSPGGILMIEGKAESQLVEVPLVNNSGYPVRLVGGTFSCSCMKSRNFPIILAPNTTTLVPITVENSDSIDRFQVTWFSDAPDQNLISCVIKSK